MNKIPLLVFLLILSACTKPIVILFENDVHCAIDNYDRIAGLRDAIKDTSEVMIVSSGDFINGGLYGTISKGEQIVKIMNSIDYSVVTLGNHEFDFGIQKMMELSQYMNANIVLTNLTDGNSYVFQPYKLVSAGRRKIAFLGCTTPTLSPMFLENCTVHDNDMANMVQENVNTVKRLGADYVILLSHLGDQILDSECSWTSIKLIQNTHGIDAVIDGHTHHVIDTLINNNIGEPVHLIQTGSELNNLGKLWINGSKITTDMIPVKNIPYHNNEVKELVDSIKDVTIKLCKEKIGFSKYELITSTASVQRYPHSNETNLGDLVSDAIAYCTEAQMAFINSASTKNPIQRGELFRYDIINSLIYNDVIFKIKISGSHIKEFLTEVTKCLPNKSGEFPQVHGIRFTIDIIGKKPILKDFMVIDKERKSYTPLSDENLYEIATSEYYIKRYDRFFGNYEEISYGKKMTDSECLEKYIKEGLNGDLPSKYEKAQGRINIIQRR